MKSTTPSHGNDRGPSPAPGLNPGVEGLHGESQEADWEADAVWQMLDRVAPVRAGGRFADDVVRMARLEGVPQVGWRKWLLAPWPVAGMAAAAAAVVMIVSMSGTSQTGSSGGAGAVVAHRAESESFADVQVAADREVLLAASDRLDQISDGDLVSLLGF